MLRYLTAGESHGPALTAIVEGFPSGVALDAELINRELKRRQGGYGRGKRQTLETDRDHRRFGHLSRRDHRRPDHAPADQQRRQARAADTSPPPRGAATSTWPARSTTRPASARSSSAPAPARRRCGSRSAAWPSCCSASWGSRSSATSASWAGSRRRRSRSTWPSATPARSTRSTPRPTRRSSRRSTPPRRPATRSAASSRRSSTGCPIGLGSHAQWDRKLDARLAAGRDEHPGDQGGRDRPGRRGRAPAGLEGDGPDRATRPTIPPDDRRFGFRRPTNNAGGIEGGTSNGEPIVVRAVQEADQHAGRARAVGQHGDQGPAARRLRAVRRLRRARRQRDRRERRGVRDRRGGGREVRRHQPRRDPGGA